MYYKEQETSPWLNCGCIILVLLINLLGGGWSVDYLLAFFNLTNMPFLADMLIGLFAAELSIPVAIVIATLRTFGVL